ncbi:MAG: M6 family metalloprotease domain-containing protein [Paludibacteraceae bacterium]|nr:M6 family metalloprotease domain-containing protein [Paludibacteraceae bacterium]
MKRLFLIGLLCTCLGAALAAPPRRGAGVCPYSLHQVQDGTGMQAPRRMSQQTGAVGQQMQPLRVPVILANFSDTCFMAMNDSLAYDSLFNSPRYTYDGATGSVRQYFIDQSGGQYSPQFEVWGPITLSQSVTYYGQNSYKNDIHAGEMIAEACLLAKEKYGSLIDFSRYAQDGRTVDAVYVVYAGYGESDGGKNYTIWPHNWTISEAGGTPPVIDGVSFSAYVCSSELFDETLFISGSKRTCVREGIGLMCHEFSHVMGLPDLYTTNGATHKTWGDWDLMDHGCYNNNSLTPPSYSAYERWFMGWQTPEQLSKEGDYTLLPLNQEGSSLALTADGSNCTVRSTDYYLLENRQQTGWDTWLPGHGLLLSRVRYYADAWNSNSVNNSSRSLLIDLIEADGQTPGYSFYNSGFLGKPGDLFPAGATEVTLYDRFTLTGITEAGNNVQFRLIDKQLTPTELVSTGDDPLVTYTQDGLLLSSQQPMQVRICTADGRLLWQGRLTTPVAVCLPHGLYLVQTAAHTRKIIR